MKSLVTGVDGFIGSHLGQALLAAGDDVIGISRSSEGASAGGIHRFKADVTDADRIAQVLDETKPDRIFHLAGMSSIVDSFTSPHSAFEVNVTGTLNLLEAIRQSASKAVFISGGSSAEYGRTVAEHSSLSEDLALRPSSPFGVSKAAQGMLVEMYARTYGVRAIHARMFAIVGPGKETDALSSFCRGVAQIELGVADAALKVGNLGTIRDFVNVRDCCSALLLTSERGDPGTTINIANGRPVRLEQIVDLLQQRSHKSFDVVLDPSRGRPSDDPRIVGDAQRLTSLGYQPSYTLETTVDDTLNYWRVRSGQPSVPAPPART